MGPTLVGFRRYGQHMEGAPGRESDDAQLDAADRRSDIDARDRTQSGRDHGLQVTVMTPHQRRRGNAEDRPVRDDPPDVAATVELEPRCPIPGVTVTERPSRSPVR